MRTHFTIMSACLMLAPWALASCSSHHDQGAQGRAAKQAPALEREDEDEDDDELESPAGAVDDEAAEAGAAEESEAAEEHEGTEHQIVYGFDDLASGALPTGWEPAETNGGGTPGRWLVQSVANAAHGTKVLQLAETHNSGGTFNLLFAPGVHPADVELEVKLRPDSGDEDRGGGLVWRGRDANNYYLTRWNPLENNLRLYKVVDAHRTTLKSVDLQVDPAAWHELKVEATGRRMEVSLDDHELIVFQDDTFRDGGRVGLWTKADAASSFDDFKIAWYE